MIIRICLFPILLVSFSSAGCRSNSSDGNNLGSESRSPLTQSEVIELVSLGAAISNKRFDEIARNHEAPDLKKFSENVPLTLFLMTIKVRPVEGDFNIRMNSNPSSAQQVEPEQGAEPKKKIGEKSSERQDMEKPSRRAREFEWLSLTPHPARITDAISASRSRGYVSFIQHQYVKSCEWKELEQEIAGSISFECPSLYRGQIEFSGVRRNDRWVITDFVLEEGNVRIYLAGENQWRLKRYKPTIDSNDIDLDWYSAPDSQ